MGILACPCHTQAGMPALPVIFITTPDCALEENSVGLGFAATDVEAPAPNDQLGLIIFLISNYFSLDSTLSFFECIIWDFKIKFDIAVVISLKLKAPAAKELRGLSLGFFNCPERT